MRLVTRVLTLLLLAGAAPARAQLADDPMAAPSPDEEPPPSTNARSRWIGSSAHVSLLSDRIDRSNINLRIGYSLTGGVRWGPFGVFGLIEHDMWVQTELDVELQRGVLSVAVGGEYRYANERVRASLAVGMSVLLEEQPLDPAPSFGLFGELRPTGLRWSRGRWWAVQVDPIGLAIIAPVLREPRLFEIQYRFTVTIEWQSPSGRRALGRER